MIDRGLRSAPYGTTLKHLCVTLELIRDWNDKSAESRVLGPGEAPSTEGEFEVLVDAAWRMPVVRMLRRPGKSHTIRFWRQVIEALANNVANGSLAPDVGILFDYRPLNSVDNDHNFEYDARMLEGMADFGSSHAGRRRGPWAMLLRSDADVSKRPLSSFSTAAYGESYNFRVFVEDDEARRWVARDEFPATTQRA